MFAFYLTIRFFIYDMVPTGWTSLVLIIIGFGGFIIFQLGLTGLYLGQVMEEARGRPLYVIANRTTPLNQVID